MASANPSIAKGDKYGDIRRRLVFLLLALIVYRIGAHIPVPGIDPTQLSQLFKTQEGGILSLFNMFSGGALSRFAVFALGIMPYISASIILQLATYVLPAFEQLKKEGESGRRKSRSTHVTALLGWLCSSRWALLGVGRHSRSGTGSRFHLSFDNCCQFDRWDHVFDVAGRANYRAWVGQRYFDFDFRQHCCWVAECNGGPV